MIAAVSWFVTRRGGRIEWRSLLLQLPLAMVAGRRMHRA